MSAIARANGWQGFNGLGEPVHGGYLYRCDGMPSQFGCGGEIVVTRPWTRVGAKKGSGWLVCYGQDFDGTLDTDVVLTFCPSCAAIVTQRDREDAARRTGTATKRGQR